MKKCKSVEFPDLLDHFEALEIYRWRIYNYNINSKLPHNNSIEPLILIDTNHLIIIKGTKSVNVVNLQQTVKTQHRSD